MKIVHLADLHIGKKLHEHDCTALQAAILQQIIAIIAAEKPTAVIIAGDIFDKAIPPLYAIQLARDFFAALAEKCHNIMLISGNHDSAERLSFMSGLMREGIYMAPNMTAESPLLTRVTLQDEYGPVEFYLLPFVKPAEAEIALPAGDERKFSSYQEAVDYLLSQAPLDPETRHVLVAHQFVTGGTIGGSEELIIGGLENIDANSLAAFDYVALGHLHRPQTLPGFPQIRYCGSPLKYSLSEADNEKSVTIAELGPKGEAVTIREVPLKPLLDLQIVEGSFMEIITAAANGEKKQDYIFYRLTDTHLQPNAAAALQAISPNFLGLEYINLATHTPQVDRGPVLDNKSPLELVQDFFTMVTGETMTAAEKNIVTQLATQVWDEKEEE